MNERFIRASALLGESVVSRLSKAKVLVVGVGGVGSWCAEALVRTGLGNITIMDDDKVAPSNINRQLQALPSTVGEDKVVALAARLLAINSECRVVSINSRFMGEFDFSTYDVVVDAIDSVDNKADLIKGVVQAGKPVFSSMGAALRLDPTLIQVTEFKKVEGDGLARALRKRFREIDFKNLSFKCVWSKERPMNCETRGSLVTITATFGMALASEVIKCLAE